MRFMPGGRYSSIFLRGGYDTITGIPPKRSRIWPEDSTWGGMFVYCREAFVGEQSCVTPVFRYQPRCDAMLGKSVVRIWNAQMIPLLHPMMSQISAMACSSIEDPA